MLQLTTMLNNVNRDKYLIITQARTVLEEFKEAVTVGKKSLIQFRMPTAPQMADYTRTLENGV